MVNQVRSLDVNGLADVNQLIRTLLSLYSDLWHETIAYDSAEGSLTSNTVEFLWLELSQHQLASRLYFYYLVVTSFVLIK